MEDEFWGTGNGHMRATKEVVSQKIIAARDVIKCHPLTPELAMELFTSKGMGVFHFSAAFIEWSESELSIVKRLCVQAYKNAWHLPRWVAPRYRFRGMGSRSNNMGADMGGRSSHAKEHSRSKASWIPEYVRLA